MFLYEKLLKYFKEDVMINGENRHFVIWIIMFKQQPNMKKGSKTVV